jgi:hypothetical protein
VIDLIIFPFPVIWFSSARRFTDYDEEVAEKVPSSVADNPAGLPPPENQTGQKSQGQRCRHPFQHSPD